MGLSHSKRGSVIGLNKPNKMECSFSSLEGLIKRHKHKSRDSLRAAIPMEIQKIPW